MSQQQIFLEQRVDNFLLQFVHDPNVPDVLWRVVTCTDCGRELAKGKLTEATAPGFGFLDGMASLGHECKSQ